MKNKFIFPISFLLISLVTLSGCHSVLYTPDVDQGNYLEVDAASRIQKGMTQEQVKYLLGSPITTDVFDKSQWIYLFRQEPSRKDLVQEMLIVTFDDEGVVTGLSHQPRTAL